MKILTDSNKAKSESENEKLKLSMQFCFEKDDFKNIGVKPEVVLKLFETIANQHAEKLGVGFLDLLSKNLLWVVMRIRYVVENSPKPNIKYTIITYPSGKNFMEFDREYIITDAKDKVIIKGQSKWCVIDTITRRPMKMPEYILFNENYKPQFEGRFLKTETFEPKYLPDGRYRISENDIDNNRHTNNTVYARLVTELLKNENKEIKTFQINFLKELFLNDGIELFFKKENKNTCYVLGRLFNKQNSFSAKIEF